MKPTEMQVGVRYVVTAGSVDDEFQPGDRIELYADGSIGNIEAQGWMEAEDVPESTRGMAVELDAAWVDRQRQRLAAQMTLMATAGIRTVEDGA